MNCRKKITVKSIIVAENLEIAKNIAHALPVTWNGSHFENEDYVIIWLVDNTLRYLAPEHHDAAWAGEWTLDSLPMIPKTLLAAPVKSTESHFEKVSAILNRPDMGTLICATNPEGEGERIFRLLCRQLGINKPFSRLWARSMTPSAILNAMESLCPSEDFDPLAASAFIKAETNWHFSMNMSRLISVLSHSRDISIGRHTPVLTILGQRRKEIEGYIPQTVYKIRLTCNVNGEKLQGYWVDPSSSSKNEFPDMFLAKQTLKSISADKAVVVHMKRQRVKRLAPQPFNTVTLIQAANEVLGYSASKTLCVTKSLFEKHRLVSFYNTESQRFPKSVLESLPVLLSSIHPHFLDEVDSIMARLKKYPDALSKLVSSEKYSHAIIPTEDQISLSELNLAEKELYLLICRRFLAALMPPQAILDSHASLSVGTHLFEAQGQKISSAGWTGLEAWNSPESSPIPFLWEQDELHVDEISIEACESKAPINYTEGYLIKAVRELEHRLEAGDEVSRNLHYSLENWVGRNVVERIGKEVVLTEKGLAQLDVLEQIAEHVKEIQILYSPEAMCLWEKEMVKDLKSQADVRVAYKHAMDKTKEFMAVVVDRCREKEDALGLIRYQAPELGLCPECQSTVIELPKGYKCSSKKQCPFFFPRKSHGTNIPSSEAKKMLSSGKTSPLRCFSSKNQKHYTASLAWCDEEKRLKPVFETDEFGTCPACKKGKIVEWKNNFGCSAYKEESCKFFIGKYSGSGGFDKAALKELIEIRLTRHFYTFAKKDGKVFEARLKLELNGEISFIYKNLR